MECFINGCKDVYGLLSIPISDNDYKVFCSYHYPRCFMCKDKLVSLTIKDYVSLCGVRGYVSQYKDSTRSIGLIYCMKCFLYNYKKSDYFTCECCNKNYSNKLHSNGSRGNYAKEQLDISCKTYNYHKKPWGSKLFKGKIYCPVCYEPTIYYVNAHLNFYRRMLVDCKSKRSIKKVVSIMNNKSRLRVKNLINKKSYFSISKFKASLYTRK